ncbi:MAG TPA: LamG-like jellyroll fold domain-containing protein, partial [Gaiellaceae bacterium]|nr:LamG-like jellyroll fold domain-containing protein [Gaiellaceae bacterium]
MLAVLALIGTLPSALAATGPPANTSPPTISGTAMQGQTLTAGPGSWSRKPTSYAYQWLRCNATGVSCGPLAGATAKTYVLTSSDVGSTLRVKVTATNGSGSGTATSGATAVVQPPPVPAANTSPPTITGTAQDGQIQTADPGNWTGTQPISYAYQWQRCDSSGANCNSIAGATAATYPAASADVGATLEVLVTATNAAGSTPATSGPSAVIQPTPPAVTAAPAISGLAQEGQTLSATTGTWSGTTPIAYTYQWMSCDSSGANCSPISASTTPNYVVDAADVGTTISVRVTASNVAGSTDADAAATAVVQSATAPPTFTSLPTVTGTAQVGHPLTADPGTWTGTQPISYAYQWQRCDSTGANCTPIAGATSVGYTATLGDVGATLEVAVTATNTPGSATVSTAPTAPVQGAQTTTIFSDDFESGNFSAWSSVQTAGDGTATVQSAIVSTGSYAAQLTESANSGSKSYVRKTFSAQQDLTATGDFRVLQQGASGGNVPLLRFLDPGGTRLVSVYRLNGTAGTIGVNYGGVYYSTTGKLALNTWANLSVHLTTNGAASTVAITLNGTQIYQTASASLGTAGIATLQLGNDTAAQAFGLVADNISVQGATIAAPPSNTSPPTIAGTAQQGQGLTAGPGTWSGTQPINFAYQWQRCDSAGANCNPISGATTTTYTLTATDVGSTIEATVTASNMAGSATASSAPTAVVVSSSAPPPGLVALWHMDETSGTTMFDSVGTHNGTLHSTQIGLPGFTGTAFGFDGSSSYVDVPSTDDLNPGAANITFTIHLKTSGTPPPPPADWDVFRKGLYTTGGAEYKMEFQQTGQASCGFQGTGGYAELVAGPAINDGQWHTVSCVKTSTAIEVVVDGQVFSKAANIGSISNTTDVAIGA